MKQLTKEEWKAQYSACRALYMAAIKMDMMHETPGRTQALNMAWQVLKEKGFNETVSNAMPHIVYPITQHRWAIKHNHRGY